MTFAAHAGRRVPASGVAASGLPLWPPRVRGSSSWRRAGPGTVRATRDVRVEGEARHALAVVDLDGGGGRVTTRVLGAGVRPGARVALVWDGLVPVFAAETACGGTAAAG